MPLIKNKYNHVKIYRPNGTKYAKGYSVNSNIKDALDDALIKFNLEFGYKPEINNCTMEVIGTDLGVHLTLFEIKDIEE